MFHPANKFATEDDLWTFMAGRRARLPTNAINRKPGVNNWRRLAFVLTHLPDPRLMLEKVRNIHTASSANGALEKAYGISLRAQVHHVEYHLSHLASAFLVTVEQARPSCDHSNK